MAVCRPIYDSHHLQADCQVTGISSGSLHLVIEYGLPLPFLHADWIICVDPAALLPCSFFFKLLHSKVLETAMSSWWSVIAVIKCVYDCMNDCCQVSPFQSGCSSMATTWRRRCETSTRNSPCATTWTLSSSMRKIGDTSNSRLATCGHSPSDIFYFLNGTLTLLLFSTSYTFCLHVIWMFYGLAVLCTGVWMVCCLTTSVICSLKMQTLTRMKLEIKIVCTWRYGFKFGPAFCI